jgi:hypothetical protein
MIAASGVSLASAAQPPVSAFDTITYRDSGGFAGGGTGKSLSLWADGRFEARMRGAGAAALRLQPSELVDLNALIAAVDWSQLQHFYRVPGAADLVMRDLVIVIHGTKYEVHAEDMAKIPAALREVFERLDALCARAPKSS